ncbi:hypothetical protein VCHA54P496_260051 [Vibrio chagasii]|nr:hypothetical protein VCHA29O37_320052 [Vibrio chagasii]CAH7162198.1 hypothetical protein VCHA54P496_260051 [Vibrio chagasii]CAH7163672.1 hypothetical protein VCHA54P495_270050 [Vibrio chagasii]CAH7428037.1 hypothetical protein VCHA54P486_330050 [Vibrio chagasii]
MKYGHPLSPLDNHNNFNTLNTQKTNRLAIFLLFFEQNHTTR